MELPFDAEGFEWDHGNRRKVERRMEVPVAEAAFLGEPMMFYDGGHAEVEPRWFLMTRVGSRHVFLVFTRRGKKIRVISARYMHDREVKKYAKKIG